MTPDPLAAALDQLAAHHEHISRLDAREAAHFATLNGHLTQLTDMITHRTSNGPDDADRYQPGAAPAWWKLTPDQRREPAAQLRAWVEQVYRPGYGHLAPPWPPAGRHTTCACTGWTSSASSGRPSTSSPAAAPGGYPPRPNTRPASCLPSLAS
jgi:hypothetical protein